MPSPARRFLSVHPAIWMLEIACALASAFLIAGGIYGFYADFQPSLEHIARMRGPVALTWLPIGLFIMADVMLFRRDVARMFFSGAALLLAGLSIVSFLGALFFWVVAVPAWRSLDGAGIPHSYAYTIIAKPERHGGVFCPGALTITAPVWFKRVICHTPEALWREAEVGMGLKLIGRWTPEGLRYEAMELKP